MQEDLVLGRGRAKRLTIYLNEAAHWHGRPLCETIMGLLLAKGLAGGTVTRAMAGFTRGSGVHTAKILDLSADLPLRIEVVDSAEAIERVIPDIHLMLERGLITVEDVNVVKYTGTSAAASAEEAPRKVTMKGKQLWIHISEKDDYFGEPLYEAIVKRFNAEEFAGVTVYRALEGFGAHHQIHKTRVLSLQREAPVVMIMVDTEENVRRAREVLDGMLKSGAVVTADVEVSFYGCAASPDDAAAPAGDS